MTKKSVETPEIETLGEVAMSRTEVFFENNGKKVVMGIIAVVAVASAMFGYKELILEPKEDRASEAMYSAQVALESSTPDYKVALEGDDNITGFLEVIENYGSTSSANLANHYAGVCYLKLGDNANASRYLAAYKPQKGIPAQIINAQNIGLQGDIAVDNKDYTSAIALFLKAANSTENMLTTPTYLRKAAQAAIAAGDEAQAKSLLEQVIANYPSTLEANNAQKYLGSIQ